MFSSISLFSHFLTCSLFSLFSCFPISFHFSSFVFPFLFLFVFCLRSTFFVFLFLLWPLSVYSVVAGSRIDFPQQKRFPSRTSCCTCFSVFAISFSAVSIFVFFMYFSMFLHFVLFSFFIFTLVFPLLGPLFSLCSSPSNLPAALYAENLLETASAIRSFGEKTLVIFADERDMPLITLHKTFFYRKTTIANAQREVRNVVVL